MTKQEFVKITMRWPVKLHKIINEIAVNEGRSFHGQVLWMLKTFIEEHYGVKP